MSPFDCDAVLRASGIPTCATRVARTADEACSLARTLGFPVVLKGSGPDILHKTEQHAVYPGLADESAVRRAFGSLSCRTDVAAVLVQPMVRGVEMLVGASFDQKFGHTVLCGSGGTLVELLHDVSCRLAPLTDVSAREMIDDLRGVTLLRGYRGAPPANEQALCEILLRLSALLDLCPEIQELDLNPVMVGVDAATVVDARIRVSSGVGRTSGGPNRVATQRTGGTYAP
jgi:acyl-CoA synthetase (NDP forming)